MSGIARHHSEWLSLIEVSGPFLTLPVLVRVFPQGLPKVDGKKLGRLRAAYEEWANAQDAKASDASALHATWVRLVLSELLEFDDQTLRSDDGLPSGLDVPLAEHHETLRPSVAIVEPSGRTKAGTPRLLIAVWPANQDLESTVPAVRWAATPLERMTQLCRSTGIRIGLVTNGERWTVVDAPVGQTAGYASWYAGLWLQEPITLAAFDALIGVRRFFAVADTDTIEALLDESVAFQQELTDQLGYQVRRAVEVLVQALDRADLDRKRELLRDVPPARLYDAALTVMMRLVFLFCAEERGLLLLGDETYDANYAVSTLRALLREEADRVGVEVLERRQDAWARLLATFRAVHGGVEHEALRLPALGGSLFDPDRFPFLEGRAAGTSWLDTPASPLPIDNRTVLHLLEALQLLRTRGDGRTSEARKLSYRALDIEQIGHVYEGLLDHVAVRVDVDTLGLTGTKDKEPELSLEEMNREGRHGRDRLIEYLKEHTGRSGSPLRNDLDAEPDEVAEQRLIVACGNDKALVKQIAPYHALIRKDVWGYPQIYRAGSFVVTGGPERRQTGTHYTPKSLTEQIVTETLEPLVYVGPTVGKPRDSWKLKSAAELLDLKICDMAMGSGAFLVQVCRWLPERVVEAWEEAERQGAVISADGEVFDKAAGHDLLPPDREERLSFARRLVAERCVYGVDINPMAVELAKLSLWLVTLAKGRPFGFLDHNLRSGDSLLGIHRLDQLTELSMMPSGKGQHRLFGQNIDRAVREVVELRQRLRAVPIRDIHDVEAMANLDTEARDKLELAQHLADGFVAAVFAAENPRVVETRLSTLSIEADRAVRGEAQTLESLKRHAASDLAKDTRDGRPRRPFHWPLEFPEVLQGDSPGFDGVVGNPPFMAGKRLTTRLGEAYTFGIKKLVSDAKGAADLCAYFFLAAARLVREGGAVGMIATNSISQGATREIGLGAIETSGWRIIRTWPDLTWSGGAAVTISPCVLFHGPWKSEYRIHDRVVSGISSYLEEEEGGSQPYALERNAGIASIGTYLNGEGFILTKDEFQQMLQADPRSDAVIHRYLSSHDINQTVDSSPSRYVIDYWDMPEEAARSYKAPFARVIKLVKPQRDKLTRQIHEACYWKHWDRREEFYGRMRQLTRVIVTGRVSKHHVFSFADPKWLIADGVVIFLRDDTGSLAVLQSAIHAEWVQRHKTTMRLDTTYSVSRCFLTFPWPDALTSDLKAIGLRYLESRAQIQRATGTGLTSLYNRLHDESESAKEIVDLRAIHRELDEAVAAAYGIAIPLEHGFHDTKQGRRFAISPGARRVIIGNLLALNRRLHADDLAKGPGGDGGVPSLPRVPRTGQTASADASQSDLDFRGTPLPPKQDSDPSLAVLAFLRTRSGWHAKADILAATGLTDGQWSAVITGLVAGRLVERQGERRGVRYRSQSESRAARGARP